VTKHFMLQKGGALWPEDEECQKRLQKIGDDNACEIEIIVPRNIKHHRKFWKMMDLVRRQSVLQDRYPTTEALVQSFKIVTGVIEPVILPDGEIRMVPGSISFAKMDQGEFDAFYTKAVKIIVIDFLGGGPEDEEGLRNEIEEMIR